MAVFSVTLYFVNVPAISLSRFVYKYVSLTHYGFCYATNTYVANSFYQSNSKKFSNAASLKLTNYL